MNAIKKSVAGVLWAVGAGPLLRSVFEPPRLAVAYHSIGGGNANAHISITPGAFREQIEYLQTRGYAFCRFGDLSAVGSPRAAALYFDDGFADVIIHAYPFLKQKGIPATLFLTTNYIDQKKAEGVYMTWDQMREINDVFEFGSHAVSHVKLNKIPLADARAEMARSKRIIEEKLGDTVVSFSYPYGRSSPELEAVAHELGYQTTTANPRFHKARPDPDDTMSIFKLKTGVSWLS